MKHLNKLYLSLTLLVARVFADHADHALATDDFALITDFLYRCTNLHTDSFVDNLTETSAWPGAVVLPTLVQAILR
jgi:hypothetical protein